MQFLYIGSALKDHYLTRVNRGIMTLVLIRLVGGVLIEACLRTKQFLDETWTEYFFVLGILKIVDVYHKLAAIITLIGFECFIRELANKFT